MNAQEPLLFTDIPCSHREGLWQWHLHSQTIPTREVRNTNSYLAMVQVVQHYGHRAFRLSKHSGRQAFRLPMVALLLMVVDSWLENVWQSTSNLCWITLFPIVILSWISTTSEQKSLGPSQCSQSNKNPLKMRAGSTGKFSWGAP
jgi:hypothetical protein